MAFTQKILTALSTAALLALAAVAVMSIWPDRAPRHSPHPLDEDSIRRVTGGFE